jgi:hypothetical protein
MKELLDAMPRTSKRNLVLLDTCFFIDIFQNGHENDLVKLCKVHDVAMTSFNALELVRVLRRLPKVRDRIHQFLKNKPKLFIVEVPVVPGDHKAEVDYVASVDPYLAQDIPDPSDAVLVACAIRLHSQILTKDKHHLFTVLLQNYVQRWDIRIHKSIHDL